VAPLGKSTAQPGTGTSKGMRRAINDKKCHRAAKKGHTRVADTSGNLFDLISSMDTILPGSALLWVHQQRTHLKDRQGDRPRFGTHHLKKTFASGEWNCSEWMLSPGKSMQGVIALRLCHDKPHRLT